jgi:hypothetical protein
LIVLSKLVLPALLLSVSACTAVPDCSRDWYETGWRDGRFGGSPWDIQYAASCGERFDQSRYASGWQAGTSARPALGGF